VTICQLKNKTRETRVQLLETRRGHTTKNQISVRCEQLTVSNLFAVVRNQPVLVMLFKPLRYIKQIMVHKDKTNRTSRIYLERYFRYYEI